MHLPFICLRILSAPMSAIRHIRKTVFKETQKAFAITAGVQQSTVSRWENGVAPTLDEMRTIREAAKKRKLKWDDQLFFAAPPPEKAEQAA